MFTTEHTKITENISNNTTETIIGAAIAAYREFSQDFNVILCTVTNCAFLNGQNYQEKLNHEEARRSAILIMAFFSFIIGMLFFKIRIAARKLEAMLL